jgi:hypothetical protein
VKKEGVGRMEGGERRRHALEQLQNCQHNVVDVTKPARLTLLSMMKTTRPVDGNVRVGVIQPHRRICNTPRSQREEGKGTHSKREEEFAASHQWKHQHKCDNSRRDHQTQGSPCTPQLELHRASQKGHKHTDNTR